jgi:hypothetical protein
VPKFVKFVQTYSSVGENESYLEETGREFSEKNKVAIK